MVRHSLLWPTALLAVAALTALSGCAAESSAAPTESPGGSAPASTTAPPTARVYACDDLATTDDVARALAPSGGSLPSPVAAIQPQTHLSDYVVPFIGGLSCSWRVGTAAGSPLEYPAESDWAYLTIKVVPAAAGSWTPYAQGDSPDDTLTTIAGIDAATGCGDPGCVISAPVGDAWVEIKMSTIFFGIGEGHFAGMTTEAILAQLQPFAASVFTTLTDAAPSQLAWPASDVTKREPACTGALKPQAIAMALGIAPFEYEVYDTNTAPKYFDGYVNQRAGFFTCYVQADGAQGTSITVGYDLAGIVDTMIDARDTEAALPQVTLEGAISGEHAVQVCADTSTWCTVIFSLGNAAYRVESRNNALAVAEAVIAQAR